MARIFKPFLLGIALLTTSLLAPASFAGETLQRVIDFKTLRVGMSGDQPPFTMTNRDGVPMGFDVDLAMALASAMKVKPEIKRMPFGDLMQALENDEARGRRQTRRR